MLITMPDWIEHIDHTGDAGFIVQADSLSGLYERAAWAMFAEVITDIETVRPRKAFSFQLDADDAEALMLAWLSELNFRHITEELVFCRFEVTRIQPDHLEAVAYGEHIDPGRHEIYTEIKAVTFHELRISRQGDLFTARIIFDL